MRPVYRGNTWCLSHQTVCDAADQSRKGCHVEMRVGLHNEDTPIIKTILSSYLTAAFVNSLGEDTHKLKHQGSAQPGGAARWIKRR